jgi:hypothetical protein
MSGNSHNSTVGIHLAKYQKYKNRLAKGDASKSHMYNQKMGLHASKLRELGVNPDTLVGGAAIVNNLASAGKALSTNMTVYDSDEELNGILTNMMGSLGK